MAFDPSDTLESFQNYVHKTLVDKIDVFVIVYSDNLSIYIKNSS